jgi:hypothetical protein
MTFLLSLRDPPAHRLLGPSDTPAAAPASAIHDWPGPAAKTPRPPWHGAQPTAGYKGGVTAGDRGDLRVEFEEAIELRDLVAVHNDLQFVALAADRLSELLEQSKDADSVLVEALQTAALIAYARCFGTGKRGRLTEETIDRMPSEGTREFHRHLKDLRDKHIAHSVNAFEQTAIGVVLSPDRSQVLGVASFHMKHISFELEGARQMAQFARELTTVVNSDIKRLNDAVLERAGSELDEIKKQPAEMRLYAPGPDQADTPR